MHNYISYRTQFKFFFITTEKDTRLYIHLIQTIFMLHYSKQASTGNCSTACSSLWRHYGCSIFHNALTLLTALTRMPITPLASLHRVSSLTPCLISPLFSPILSPVMGAIWPCPVDVVLWATCICYQAQTNLAFLYTCTSELISYVSYTVHWQVLHVSPNLAAIFNIYHWLEVVCSYGCYQKV